MRNRGLIFILMLLPAISACSSGGNTGSAGTTAAVEYSMSDVVLTNISSTVGKQGGFIYSTQREVAIDIKLPYPDGVVTIYESRPLTSIYGASGTLLDTAVAPEPAVLAQGQSSTTPESDGLYHYHETIILPAASTTVYLATPVRLDVPIVWNSDLKTGFVSYSFALGGAR